MTSPPAIGVPQTGPHQRFERVDALRGLAMIWMAAFHFSFDLDLYGVLLPQQDFYRDPLWTGQRICIVSLFLFCAGLGQALALRGEPGTGLASRRFWRRWLQVAVCALLVSAGSALMFPQSWISFGVLHAMAVLLLLCRLAAPLKTGLWVVGAAAVALWLAVAQPFFDTRATNWIGLVTHKPVTEDWVPVLPWLAVMVWGLAGGRALLRRMPGLLGGGLAGRPLRLLAGLGRWPLSFYMLHQPLLIGGLQGGRSLGFW